MMRPHRFCASPSCQEQRVNGSHFCAEHTESGRVSVSLHDVVEKLKARNDAHAAHLANDKRRPR